MKECRALLSQRSTGLRKMSSGAYSLKSCFFFVFFRVVFRKPRDQISFNKKGSHNYNKKHEKYLMLAQSRDSVSLSKQTIIFDVEGTLLRSSSLFPYFMLVAFEAGSFLRAFCMLLVSPLVCSVNKKIGIKIMVMVCFCGLKKDSFRAGRAVLPKFFMENVGLEGYKLVMRAGKKVGVSDLPRIMIEGFLREYMEVDVVVGRKLKVFNGYYVGLMEKETNGQGLVKETEALNSSNDVVGFASFHGTLHHHRHLYSLCKDVYMVSNKEKRSRWQTLPKATYPKPLVFHDGRLALRPTPLSTLAMFTWLPFSLPLAILRTTISLSLPHKISNPILGFLGLRLLVLPRSNNTPTPTNTTKGTLYVCNHRTLLDPLYLSSALNKPVTAVTYSLSRVSELLAPIKTVRLTRDRQVDANKMDELLSQGDLVICPEGTTCREPYLLRFSPLFAEMGEEILPVAIDVHVSMFYGTTASGFKCLDPLFFLMNPFPGYKLHLLEKVCGTRTAGSQTQNDGYEDEPARVKIANHVQQQIGKALGFQCTNLSRKDKYLMLAGNEGIVKNDRKPS